MFQDGKDLNISGGGKVQGRFNLLPAPEFNLNYAPINHLGIISSFRSVEGRQGYMYPIHDKPEYQQDNNILASNTGYRGELGVGYFAKIDEKGIFDFFLGSGYGAYGYNSDNGYQVNYSQFFAQMDIGGRDKSGAIVFGGRIFQNSYFNFRPGPAFSYTSPVANYSAAVDSFVLLDHQRFLFYQVYIHEQIGNGPFLFYLQLGFTNQTSLFNLNANQNDITGTSGFYISAGVTYNLDRKQRLRLSGKKKKSAPVENVPEM